MTLEFLALLGAPYIYDISSLRVKRQDHFESQASSYQKSTLGFFSEQ